MIKHVVRRPLIIEHLCVVEIDLSANGFQMLVIQVVFVAETHDGAQKLLIRYILKLQFAFLFIDIALQLSGVLLDLFVARSATTPIIVNQANDFTNFVYNQLAEHAWHFLSQSLLSIFP